MSFLPLLALRQAMQHCITNKEIMALLVFSFLQPGSSVTQ
jgi:hypothetical protein